MTDTLIPETLKTLRENKRWTQAQLAEKSSCSKEQIGRWERGEATNLRKTSQDRLAKALGVPWEELTKPVEKDQTDIPSWLDSTIQLNVRVDKSTRTNLGLVSIIYKISWREIIELAPLLFAITAEQSLAARSDALSDSIGHIEDGRNSAQSAAPYMSDAFDTVGYNVGWIEGEESSIKEHEIFKEYYDRDEEAHSPFVNYLDDQIRGWLTGTEISPTDSETPPEYEFPEKMIQGYTGISDDNETDKTILNFIKNGDIDFREVLSKKYKLETDEFRTWLDEEHKKVQVKLDDEFFELCGINFEQP